MERVDKERNGDLTTQDLFLSGGIALVMLTIVGLVVWFVYLLAD